jgi:hypothetical protein
LRLNLLLGRRQLLLLGRLLLHQHMLGRWHLTARLKWKGLHRSGLKLLLLRLHRIARHHCVGM